MLACLALVPPTVRLARARNLLDAPDAERRLHRLAVPRLGGLAVWLSCAIGVGVALAAGLQVEHAMLGRLVALGSGIALMLATGLIDDLRGMRAGAKFAAQCAAALIVIAAGVRIDTIAFSSSAPFALGWLAVPVTLLWIVGVTNAFNIIDGLDGLASGVALIALATFAGAALLLGNRWTLLLVLPLAASVGGFLRYNVSPARIFLGDVGSLSIGFALAVLGIECARGGAGEVHLAVPVFALSFALMDTAVAMLRRWLRGAPLTGADGRHVHHQLVGLGLSHARAAELIWLFSLGVATLGLSIEFAPPAVTVALAALGASLWVLLVVHGTRWLQYHEFSEAQASFSSGLLRARGVIRERILARDLEAKIRRVGSMPELIAVLEQSQPTFGFQRVQIVGPQVPGWLGLPDHLSAHGRHYCLECPLMAPSGEPLDHALRIAWLAQSRTPPLYAERVVRMIAPALQERVASLIARRRETPTLDALAAGTLSPVAPVMASMADSRSRRMAAAGGAR